METTIPKDALSAVLALAEGKANLNQLIVADGQMFWKKVATVGPGNNTEVDTLVDLGDDDMLEDVMFHVKTAEVTATTKTLDFGLLSSESGGDSDGFADGIDVSSTGWKRPGVTVTSGVFASTLRGALLREFTAGADSDDRGLYNEKPHLAGSVTAKSLSFKRGDTLAECVTDIWAKISRLNAGT